MRLIDADELKTILSEEITERFVRWDKTITVAEWETFTRDVIDNAPTVEQKYYERVIAQINPVIEARPQGEWIKNDYLFQYVCSNCGKIPTMYTGYALSKEQLKEYRFCRFCGAQMVKDGADMRGKEE